MSRISRTWCYIAVSRYTSINEVTSCEIHQESVQPQADIHLESVTVAEAFLFNAPPGLPKGKSSSLPPNGKGAISKDMFLYQVCNIYKDKVESQARSQVHEISPTDMEFSYPSSAWRPELQRTISSGTPILPATTHLPTTRVIEERVGW